MARPQPARITCPECKGWYNSDSELRDHMQAAHRRCVSEPSTLPRSSKTQLAMANDEWVTLSVQFRNRIQAHFSPEGLEAIDRFILLVSQGSLFDDVRR